MVEQSDSARYNDFKSWGWNMNTMAATLSAKSVLPPIRLLRLVLVAVHVLRGVAIAALLFPFVSRGRRIALIKDWSAGLLKALAIRIEVNGLSSLSNEAPIYLVANHVSWLDIFVINAVHPARFVAKSDIRAWPLIGWLCERAGTLFVQRNRGRHTAHVNKAILAALEKRETIAVFPEATTTQGDVVLPFHASLLAPAIQCNALVCPLAIRYLRSDGTMCAEANLTGTKSMTTSLLLMATQPVIFAQLQVLPSIAAESAPHRKAIAGQAAARIAAALGVPIAVERRLQTANVLAS